MNEHEDPVITLLRLINSKIKITKDNGDAAKVLATEASFDRELLLKEYDSQVTLQMDPGAGVADQKLNLQGSLRRQMYNFKCTVNSIDKANSPGADLGRVMRNKVTEQIKKIIRENRSLPNQTALNFAGLGYPVGDQHKAFAVATDSELAPHSASWVELTNLEYQGIWYSDDIRYSKSVSVNGQYALMLFRFKVDALEQCVKSLVLHFEGYGTAPAGNGLTLKVWNHLASEWQLAQTGSSSEDESLTISVTANCPDYIDSNGYVWLFAKTTNPSDGSTAAVLFCDFAELIFQVRGISYCDVVGYKPVDVVDVKPFIFKTEFALKGWAFEQV